MSGGDLVPGRKLGRYVIDEHIASGGMGIVFRGRATGAHGFERKVALKTIHPKLIESDAHRKRFINEARIVSTIHHDNVVEVIDVCEEEGVLFLVLEWLDGPSALTLLQRAHTAGKDVPARIYLRIVLDVLEGVQYAHDLKDDQGKMRGLVHRDISPENILVTDRGKTVVIDFGIAKAQGWFDGNTATGNVLGKLPFIAPEQARAEPLDRRADIWAIGAVLRLLATKTHAHEAPSDVQHLYMLSVGQDPDPLPPEAPPWLEEILASAMAVDLDKRFPTCSAFAEALMKIGVPIATHSDVAKFVAELKDVEVPANLTAPRRGTTTTGKVAIAPSTRPPALAADPPTDRGVTASVPPPARPKPVLQPAEAPVTPPRRSRFRSVALLIFALGIIAMVVVLVIAVQDDSGAPGAAAASAPPSAQPPPPPSVTPVTSVAATPHPPPPPATAEEPATIELPPPTTTTTKSPAKSRPAGSRATRPPAQAPPSPASPTPKPGASFTDYGF